MKRELCVSTLQITEDGKMTGIKKTSDRQLLKQLPSGTVRLCELVIKSPAACDDTVIYKTCASFGNSRWAQPPPLLTAFALRSARRIKAR